MKIVISMSVFLLGQLSVHADLGKYLNSRVSISASNGPWETDALMVIQIGTYRGEKSTQIDSIIKRSNGDLILIRDQFERMTGTSEEWQISRMAIKLINPLNEKTWDMLTEVSSIENLQSKVKDENASSISSIQRYLHIYSPKKKWNTYDLVTFPALGKNPKAYEEWEGNFRAVFKSFPGPINSSSKTN